MRARHYDYARDPLCWLAGLLYLANSGLQSVGIETAFSRNYLNDCLLIPCALPLVLWVHHRLGWRPQGRLPSAGEIVGHLVVWSVVAESLGPRLFPWAVGDAWDVVAYATGALLAGCWWHWGPRYRVVCLEMAPAPLKPKTVESL